MKDQKAVRKRKFGDRKDGRKLRNLPAVIRFMPYVMRDRNDACNTYADELNVDKTELYCRDQVKNGRKNFTILHVILAAYVRTISQKPQINRFVSGQRIYARDCVEVNMMVKKAMTSDGEEVAVKVRFLPSDTLDDVYEKFNEAVQEALKEGEEQSAFQNVNGLLAKIPNPVLRFVMCILRWMDYHGWLPQILLDVSPFHGSMIVTSMGSLGIKPIYHHLYNFGNLPVFLAYGKKRYGYSMTEDGTVEKHRFIDIKAVTDERICDGYYYASAFKMFKRLLENPELLEIPPETIVEDID